MSDPSPSTHSFPRLTPSSRTAATLSTAVAGTDNAAAEPLAPSGEAESPLSALAPLARLVARRAVRQRLRFRGYTMLQLPVALALVALLLAAALVLGRLLGGQ